MNKNFWIFLIRYFWGFCISLLSLTFVLLYGITWLGIVLVMSVAVVAELIGQGLRWLICSIYSFLGPTCRDGEDLRNPLSRFTKWFLEKVKI